MAGPNIQTEIEIEAPIERVWAALSDWPKLPSWSRWLQSISGEQRVGAELAVKLQLGSRSLPIRPKLIRFDDGRGFCWRGHALVPGIFDGDHSFDLEQLDEGRTLFRHAEQFGGLLSGITLRLARAQIETGFLALNRSLKKHCETPGSSGAH